MRAHKARKRFGQNFLTDLGIVDRIIEAVRPEPGDLLIEIGPGQAALTTHLADSGAELHLIELDRDLAEALRQRYAGRPRVHVHQADALTADYGELAGDRKFRLVGNLPYNISTPLLFHILDWGGQIIDMHFMLQQEVVNRMAAEPGTKAWGRLSIMCQLRCSVAPLFTVPPQSFNPAPRVQSAVVRLVPHDRPPVQIVSMKTFDRLVVQAFSMRRKTLRNSLRGLIEADRLSDAGIDPSARPETLSLQQFAVLSNLIAD